MAYQFTELREEIIIKRIVSVHYFEYMSDFSFPGESHNFWELLYVDKGEVLVTAGREKQLLRQGQVVFHKPNEFHALAANRVIAPNLVVLSFEAISPCMSLFENKIMTIGEYERSLLAQIIVEARDTYIGPMDDPYLENLTRSDNVPFASEQLIKTYLEQFLIQLVRNFSGRAIIGSKKSESTDRQSCHDTDSLYNDILSYLDKNIGKQITVEEISRDNLISVSKLKTLFRTHSGGGVIEYFNQMKIKAAKQLIRNQQMNFTQIADFLGYTSVHYFSRHFKNATSMTPSEYRSSIMRRADRPTRSTL